MSRLSILVLALGFLVGTARLDAQQGDRKGHVMTPPPEEWHLPAPVLSPGEALETFAFGEDGFVLELVAAEPLVQNPAVITFDGNGRAWVCEMRDYMPNVNGTGEDARTGRIRVLLDHDGDGAADEAKVFLEGLYHPRALQFVKGGILWADQEKLYFTGRTGNGGLEAGETRVVDPNWAPDGNIEHKPNGLVYSLDNWLYNAKSRHRYRLIDGEWIKDEVEFRGQWGLAQDDHGRLVTNTNSNLVMMERVAPGYVERNPNHRFATPATASIDNAVFPSRITCGINRGYQDGMLDERGFLTRATGAGGLTIYRGDNFPPEFYGNVFVPEPAGLLLKRAILKEKDGLVTAHAAYPDREFLTSVDERNRFVNAATAPDGTLYLLDLYHGIIQHRTYVTTYLREQILRRGLDQGNEGGRIYRVRWANRERGELPQMEEQSAAERVAHLEHPNGWWRDTAQRMIVQSGEGAAVAPLREVLSSSESSFARIHALWALEGLGALEANDVALAVSAEDPAVAAQAIRASEVLLSSTESTAELLSSYRAASERDEPRVRQALAAALGQVRGDGQTEALEMLAKVLREGEGSSAAWERLVRDLALSGLHGVEMDFLPVAVRENLSVTGALAGSIARSGDEDAVERLFAWVHGDELSQERQGEVLRQLARAVVEERKPDLARLLLAHAVADADDRAPVRDGMLAGKKKRGFKKLVVAGKPASLEILEREDPAYAALNQLFEVRKPVSHEHLKAPEAAKLFELGRVEYARICAGCHQPNGQGLTAMAPPLVDSEWVSGPLNRLIALVLDGVAGPIEVAGKVYQAPEIQPVMPGIRMNPELDDEKIAGILTYVRNAWGHSGPVVKPSAVEKWRSSTELRAPYSAAELKEIK